MCLMWLVIKKGQKCYQGIKNKIEHKAKDQRSEGTAEKRICEK